MTDKFELPSVDIKHQNSDINSIANLFLQYFLQMEMTLWVPGAQKFSDYLNKLIKEWKELETFKLFESEGKNQIVERQEKITSVAKFYLENAELFTFWELPQKLEDADSKFLLESKGNFSNRDHANFEMLLYWRKLFTEEQLSQVTPELEKRCDQRFHWGSFDFEIDYETSSRTGLRHTTSYFPSDIYELLSTSNMLNEVKMMYNGLDLNCMKEEFKGEFFDYKQPGNKILPEVFLENYAKMLKLGYSPNLLGYSNVDLSSEHVYTVPVNLKVLYPDPDELFKLDISHQKQGF